MKSFAIELTDEVVKEIKEFYEFKSDADVRKQLEYWCKLSWAEVVLRDIIKVLERKQRLPG